MLDDIPDGPLPENYRPASSPDVPANSNCGNCNNYKNFHCLKWDAHVSPAYYCNSWVKVQGLPNDNPGQTVQSGDISDSDPNYFQPPSNMFRAVSFEIPAYISASARKGLDFYGKGLAGDGLTDKTVREARELVAGRATEDKIVRSAAWGKRHLVDLDSVQNRDPSNDQFPGPGAVAFYLWGIDPTDPKPAMEFYERTAEKIQSERVESKPAPKKDQIKGSKKNPEGSAGKSAGAGTIQLTEAIETGLKNKVTDHNESLGPNPAPSKKATVGMLRAVYRRGSGAYSTSHRPGISRAAWSMARVNAFLVLLKRGRPANPKYITDNDLLPKGHPRSSRNA